MGSKSSNQVQETSQERALAEHAQNLMKDYKARWEPVQMQLAGQIEKLGEPGSAAQKLAEGKATADVNQEFGQAQGKLEKALTDSGAGPGSSRFNLAVTGMGADQAKSRGLSNMIADQQISDAYTEGLGALMSLGRGQRASVGNSLERQAAMSSGQARADAEASLMGAESTMGVIGQAAGYGMQQFGKPNKFGSGYDPNTGGYQGPTGQYPSTPQAGV